MPKDYFLSLFVSLFPLSFRVLVSAPPPCVGGVAQAAKERKGTLAFCAVACLARLAVVGEARGKRISCVDQREKRERESDFLGGGGRERLPPPPLPPFPPLQFRLLAPTQKGRERKEEEEEENRKRTAGKEQKYKTLRSSGQQKAIASVAKAHNFKGASSGDSGSGHAVSLPPGSSGTPPVPEADGRQAGGHRPGGGTGLRSLSSALCPPPLSAPTPVVVLARSQVRPGESSSGQKTRRVLTVSLGASYMVK